MVLLVRRAAIACACWLAGAGLLSSVSHADTGPRYTYIGAGYEWDDSRCAVRIPEQRVNGFNVQGSLGIFRYLHALGDYFRSEDTKFGHLDCYRLGLGASYPITDHVDIVGRAQFAHAKLGDVSDHGYDIEGGVRLMASDKAEIHLAYARTDLGDIATRDVRLGLVYNITPMFALRAGGVVFDRNTGFDLGVRVYLGNHLF